MIRVEIKSMSVGEQTIKPREDGKKFEPFTKISQTAYVHGMVDRNGAPEPYAVKINVDLGNTKERRQPFAVGLYDIDACSFHVGKFDDLQIGRLSLIPVSKAS